MTLPSLSYDVPQSEAELPRTHLLGTSVKKGRSPWDSSLLQAQRNP
jgi:hypothetical protein